MVSKIKRKKVIFWVSAKQSNRFFPTKQNDYNTMNTDNSLLSY